MRNFRNSKSCGMERLSVVQNCVMSRTAVRGIRHFVSGCPRIAVGGRLLQSGMTKRHAWYEKVNNQDGSVLVIALLILVFLTLIGISSSTITQIEIQIAGNERAYNIAFNVADSGVYLIPKIIRRTVEEGAQPVLSGISYLDSGNVFFREVMGYNAHDAAKDISFTLDSHTVSVDVARARQISVHGGGVEFGSGSEGVGVGSAGGVAVIYDLDSVGTGPNTAQSNVVAEYRLVPGVAGGL